jgi:hypothetical protein
MERNNKDQSQINKINTKKTIQANNETKSWFFEKINMINKPLANPDKTEEKLQINKIKDEKGNITTILNKIQTIIRENLEN